MLNLVVKNSGMTEAELQQLINADKVIRLTQDTSAVVRSPEHEVLVALLASGTSILVALIGAIVPHILKSKQKEREDDLKSARPTETKILIITGSGHKIFDMRKEYADPNEITPVIKEIEDKLKTTQIDQSEDIDIRLEFRD